MLAVGIWGARENRRWVVNLAAVFGGIHFYTQWFAILGANALSVLGGGALILPSRWRCIDTTRRRRPKALFHLTKGVDGRDEPGHDDRIRVCYACSSRKIRAKTGKRRA